MSTLHLTELAVQRLKEPGTYYDETTPAFGLRVGKNRKTWFVIRGRERLRTTIGRYPTMSLKDAREEARKLLTDTFIMRAYFELLKDATTGTHEQATAAIQRRHVRRAPVQRGV